MFWNYITLKNCLADPPAHRQGLIEGELALGGVEAGIRKLMKLCSAAGEAGKGKSTN